MMHGIGMGAFGLVWVLVPLLLLGGGAAIVAILASRRRRLPGRERDDGAPRELPRQDGPTGSKFAHRIFSLAKARGGSVTVSDIVIETGLSPADAEERMNRLVDGVHVTMEVSDDGRVRYEFPELRQS